MTTMAGKICLVTGATGGIGKQTALRLAALGATVIVVGRDPERAATAAADIRRRVPGARVEALAADLSSLARVRQLADEVLTGFDRLDVLVNNAGIITTRPRTTVEGFESTFATNHLAPFLLTSLLRDRLTASAPARVVNVASAVHKQVRAIPWDHLAAGAPEGHGQAYAVSKLLNVLFTAELARRLAGTDAAVIMKLGRTFAGVREALRQAGRLESARYVERASTGAELSCPVADVDPASVPYFSMIIVPAVEEAPDESVGRLTESATIPAIRRQFFEEGSTGPAPALEAAEEAQRRRLLVVGLGPGPDAWLTPEVSAALAEVDHVVGYGPYVDRVPQRPGLQRHASGNTVELDRARLALDLAASGKRVAVVSGGDAGVFGMAAAVFEAAAAGPSDVQVTVLPGVSAAQVVAARAGAPLGGDYAVLSLSDRLKPWPVIEQRLRAVAGADLAIAVYNPASRSRRDQVAEARRILLELREPSTPVVVGRDVGRRGESILITTLAELDPATIDMKCLLIIGSSRTRVDNGRVWTPRSTD